MQMHSKKISIHTQRKAEDRAALYRHLLPEWPALADSFARDAARIAAALKAKS
jgi:hypothetical protein